MICKRMAMHGFCSVFLVLVLAVSASPAAEPRVENVTVERARQLIQEHGEDRDFVVLDVRTPAEFAGTRLPGAVNLDLQSSDFESRLGALDRQKTYLVYCRSGNRSARAVQAMMRLGFRSVYHLPGGILAWDKR